MIDWPYDDLPEDEKFEVVYADFAWRFKGNSAAKPGRNPMRHYKTMTLAEGAALPVKQAVAKNAVLFFWVTTPFLAIGAHISIMKAWGFKPTAVGFTWIKLNQRAASLFWTQRDLKLGTGLTTRKNSECCIIGKRGRSLRVSRMVHEVIVSPVREHSRKPVEAIERIEQYVGPGRRMLEMFSREARPGWSSFGDEAGKFNKEKNDGSQSEGNREAEGRPGKREWQEIHDERSAGVVGAE